MRPLARASHFVDHEEPHAGASGLYVYGHLCENWISGPYGREQVPAQDEEFRATEEEGVGIHLLSNPVLILGDRAVTGVRLQRQSLGEFDSSGRRRAVPIPGSEFDMPSPSTE